MMEHELQSGLDDQQSSGETPPDLPLVAGYQRLEDAILDECFPEVDLALRRGRHIHKGDERWFRFLSEAQGLLEAFYRRYGCELEQRSDGYFFLLPVSDGLGKRHLGVPEMIVGQGLALCYLDPQSVQSGGVVTREELLNQLAAVMGTDALMNTLNPKRKRVDERVMQRTVRQKVNEALRRLSLLGFVELLDAEQLRLAPSLMRFAEPVRGLDAPSEALKRLIERGEVSLGPGDTEARDGEEEARDGEEEARDGEEEEHDELDEGADALTASAADPTIAADEASTESSASADSDPSTDSPESGARVAVDLQGERDADDADDDGTAYGDGTASGDADGAAYGHETTGVDTDGTGGDGAAYDDETTASGADGASEQPALAPEVAATSHDGSDELAAPAPRAALASPAATYEGFPANDRSHAEDDDGASEDDADHGRGEHRDAENMGNVDGATHDAWGDDTARTAGRAETPAPEHVEFDFDWDNLPDEEA